jgi:hypothetical protein
MYAPDARFVPSTGVNILCSSPVESARSSLFSEQIPSPGYSLEKFLGPFECMRFEGLRMNLVDHDVDVKVLLVIVYYNHKLMVSVPIAAANRIQPDHPAGIPTQSNGTVRQKPSPTVLGCILRPSSA